MSQTEINDLKIQLNQLLDEYDALNEQYNRVPEDAPEANMIIAEMDSLQNIIGKIEERLELLR